jgi:rare lipoprotein A
MNFLTFKKPRLRHIDARKSRFCTPVEGRVFVHLIKRITLVTGLIAIAGFTGGAVQAHHPKRFSGLASFYSIGYRGPTADGERYNPKKLTAAHRSLPFGTVLRVTNKVSGRSVTVTVNDRGPFVRGRVLDLSLAAAKALHMVDRGVVPVTAVIE